VHQNLLRFARRRLAQLRFRCRRSRIAAVAAIVLDVQPGGGIPQAPSQSCTADPNGNTLTHSRNRQARQCGGPFPWVHQNLLRFARRRLAQLRFRCRRSRIAAAAAIVPRRFTYRRPRPLPDSSGKIPALNESEPATPETNLTREA
jgi:hypothetical protein